MGKLVKLPEGSCYWACGYIGIPIWQTPAGLHCLGVHLRSRLTVAASFGSLRSSPQNARGLRHLHVQRVDQRLRCGPGMGEIIGTAGKPPRLSFFRLIWVWFEVGLSLAVVFSPVGSSTRTCFDFALIKTNISKRPCGFHHGECGAVRLLRCAPVAGGPGDAGVLWAAASWDGRFQCAPRWLPLGRGAGADGRDEPSAGGEGLPDLLHWHHGVWACRRVACKQFRGLKSLRECFD